MLNEVLQRKRIQTIFLPAVRSMFRVRWLIQKSQIHHIDLGTGGGGLAITKDLQTFFFIALLISDILQKIIYQNMHNHSFHVFIAPVTFLQNQPTVRNLWIKCFCTSYSYWFGGKVHNKVCWYTLTPVNFDLHEEQHLRMVNLSFIKWQISVNHD